MLVEVHFLVAGVSQIVLGDDRSIPRALRSLILPVEPPKYVIGLDVVIVRAMLQFLDRVHIENFLISIDDCLRCLLASIVDLDRKIGIPLEIKRVYLHLGLSLVDSWTVCPVPLG